LKTQLSRHLQEGGQELAAVSAEKQQAQAQLEEAQRSVQQLEKEKLKASESHVLTRKDLMKLTVRAEKAEARAEDAEVHFERLKKSLGQEREGTRRLQRQLEQKSAVLAEREVREKSWLRSGLHQLLLPLLLMALQSVAPMLWQSFVGAPLLSEAPAAALSSLPSETPLVRLTSTGTNASTAMQNVSTAMQNVSKVASPADPRDSSVGKRPAGARQVNRSRPQEHPLLLVLRRARRRGGKDLAVSRQASLQQVAVKNIQGLPTLMALASVILGYASKR